MPKTTNARSKTGSKVGKLKLDNCTADMLLKLEGCTIEACDARGHKWMVSHPDCVGISIACNSLTDAVEGFRHFKVMT